MQFDHVQSTLKNFISPQLNKLISKPFLLLFISVGVFITLLINYEIDAPSLIASTAGAFFGTASAFLFNITDIQNRVRSNNKAALRKAEYLINKIYTNNREINSYIYRCLKKNNISTCKWEKIGLYDNFFAIPEIDMQSMLFLIENLKEYSLFFVAQTYINEQIFALIPGKFSAGYLITDNEKFYFVDKAKKRLQTIELKKTQMNNLKKYFNFSLNKNIEQNIITLVKSLSLEQLQFITFITGHINNILDNILLVYAENKDLLHILGERNKKYGTYIDKTENIKYKDERELKDILGERLFLDIEILTKRFVQTSRALSKHCRIAAKNINDFLQDY